jgi:tRNA (guanine37-N1)-methyltransferase
MRFDVITLFPELFAPHLSSGITRRAFAPARSTCACGRCATMPTGLPPRRRPPFRRRPRHGDAGRAAAARAGRRARRPRRAPAVVHFTPTGRALTQALVQEIAAGPGAVLLCGRYEGIDQRFIDRHVTLEISLGDFVLSGGELPALVLLDAVARLQTACCNAPSHQQDSFLRRAARRPAYSRPERWSTPDGEWACRRCCCRATMARLPPGGGSVAGTHGPAAARPDRGCTRAGPPEPPTSASWSRSGYTRRLFDPLAGPTLFQPTRARSPGAPPWT